MKDGENEKSEVTVLPLQLLSAQLLLAGWVLQPKSLLLPGSPPHTAHPQVLIIACALYTLGPSSGPEHPVTDSRVCDFPIPAHIFVNSPIIKPSSNYPRWVCHFFHARTLTDTSWFTEVSWACEKSWLHNATQKRKVNTIGVDAAVFRSNSHPPVFPSESWFVQVSTLPMRPREGSLYPQLQGKKS